jgi:hypothetical protein
LLEADELKTDIQLRRASEQEAERIRKEEEERKRKAEETRKQKEAAEKKRKEDEVKKRVELQHTITFRYPHAQKVMSVSLLSHTAEIDGKKLQLDSGSGEWTTQLLLPAGSHRFRFLLSGKEKTVSPLHEKDKLGIFPASMNTCFAGFSAVPISLAAILLIWSNSLLLHSIQAD